VTDASLAPQASSHLPGCGCCDSCTSGVAGVFAAARAAAPAVLFLDEVDAVAPARPHAAATGVGGGRSGGPAADAAARLVATLLSEMDGGGAGDHP
jgi:SpoVK/Ycf46/Vps4 family AAA+-type ATPase